MHNTDQAIEKVILVAVEDDSGSSAESSLDELALLADTAGAEVVGRLIQKREHAHPGHYLGKGKIEELKDLVSLTHATGIITDDELTSAQQRNMDRMLGVKIMDRTLVILDIFATRAITAEGKVQVELAQLRYRLSHLTGAGGQMSRLGAGIGTRGPGENKLETDRRHIRNRISTLKDDLEEIVSQRKLIRERRHRTGIPVVSMVGYTNAGKSTLMNALTNAGVFAEDKLFATLDTTTRRMQLPSGFEFLFTDTVGFIQKLPHHLIQAFKATLEELHDADILVHVIDASNPRREEQMSVVRGTLQTLGCYHKPTLNVYNKIDLEVEHPLPVDKDAVKSIGISAKTNENISTLMDEMESVLKNTLKKINLLIPYTEGQLIHRIHSQCSIIMEEHRDDGTYVEVFASGEMQNRLEPYRVL